VAGQGINSAFCPVYHHAVELIGRRWTGAILRAMLFGATRFSDIAASIPGLSDRLLSERLKELEAEGIVSRDVYAQTPVRIEYHLTEKGQALSTVIEAISDWANTWSANAVTAPSNICTGQGCTTSPGMNKVDFLVEPIPN